jgi:S1-C subfamily serine protease
MRSRVLAVLVYQTFLYGGFCQSFDLAEITKKTAPAVVLVAGVTDEGNSVGSGFVISSDGKIATNLHVIQNLRTGGVQLASGEKFDSFSVLAFDERRDIAIIKIAGFDLPSVSLGNSNSVQVGEHILTMGSPLGFQGSVVKSILDDPFGGGFKMIQTDAVVSPGNSGGPLVNQKAEVVGIIRYRIGGTESLTLAVPINYLRGMMGTPLTAMSLDELRARLAKKTDVNVLQASEKFPALWTSLVSGTTKVIRRDGDRIYVETILPEDAKQAGCFSLADLQKHGNVYSGTTRFSCVCQYKKLKFGTGQSDVITNHYSSEYPIEITRISPTRIEGISSATPQDATFDCETRRYSKPEARQQFVWIPQ